MFHIWVVGSGSDETGRVVDVDDSAGHTRHVVSVV